MTKGQHLPVLCCLSWHGEFWAKGQTGYSPPWCTTSRAVVFEATQKRACKAFGKPWHHQPHKFSHRISITSAAAREEAPVSHNVWCGVSIAECQYASISCKPWTANLDGEWKWRAIQSARFRHRECSAGSSCTGIPYADSGIYVCVHTCVCVCARASVRPCVGVCVCVKPCLLRVKKSVRCSGFVLKQGAEGLSLTLRQTKIVIDRCVNVPARDAPGRNGRRWGPTWFHIWMHVSLLAKIRSNDVGRMMPMHTWFLPDVPLNILPLDTSFSRHISQFLLTCRSVFLLVFLPLDTGGGELPSSFQPNIPGLVHNKGCK